GSGFSTEATGLTRYQASSGNFTFNASGNTSFQVTSANVLLGFNQDVCASGSRCGTYFGRTGLDITQVALGAGAPVTPLLVVPGAHTALTASTAWIPVKMSSATLTWQGTGATVAAEYYQQLQQLTFAAGAGGTTTFTKAATLEIDGAPIAGSNVAITNDYSLYVAAGQTELDGLLRTTRVSLGAATALIAGDFALSAGWGSTASIGSLAGTDGAWTGTITTGGSGIAANPTLALTFHDGTWTSAPVCVVEMSATSDGTNLTTKTTYTRTATVLTITFNGTPVTGNTYVFSSECTGVQ
ncbi:MAG TPA: hypothetical protein VI259_12785, partial [Gemmatimonadaceae bacterium]